MDKCMNCKHIQCDPGDRWSPTQYFCEMGEYEDDCPYYQYHDYLFEAEQEENRRYDAKLQGWDWREARGDYD